MGPTYTTTVDLSTSNGQVTVANVSGATAQLTAVSFLSGPKGDTGATGAKGDTGATGAAGSNAPSDHTLLSNIGTNTHAQIDTKLATSTTHIADTANPHSVTKTQVGLSNVDNTSDASKPVSTATATALAGKAATSHTHAESDVTNLVSDLAAKAPLASPTFTGTVTAPTFSGSGASLTSIPESAVTNLVTDLSSKAATTYVDTQDALKLSLTGGMLTGDLVINDANTTGNPFTISSPTNAEVALITNTTNDAKIFIRATGTAKGAFAFLQGSTNFVGVQGYNTAANLLWRFGTFGGTGFEIYTNNTSGTGSGTTRAMLIDYSQNTSFMGNVSPGTNANYTLGTSSLYWSNLYASRHYFNSTSYLDGSTTAGRVDLTGDLYGSATSTIRALNVFAYGADASVRLTNTNDSTTEYARMQMTYKSMQLSYNNTNSPVNIVYVGSLLGSASINYIGTAKTVAVITAADLTTVLDDGAGNMKLQAGLFFPLQKATASAPTYVKGGVYFDTTLNKLRIGGATGWETVTST